MTVDVAILCLGGGRRTSEERWEREKKMGAGGMGAGMVYDGEDILVFSSAKKVRGEYIVIKGCI